MENGKLKERIKILLKWTQILKEIFKNPAITFDRAQLW